ncbi:Sodium/sulfate symporter [Coemansia mojavensis]|nr:Sodium/sulfate symporter [Coemansia mojavensis]
MRIRVLGSWKGYVEWIKSSRLVSALPALMLAFGIAHMPVPADLTSTSMRLLGVFAGVIMGLLTADYNMSVILAVALLVLTLTKSFMCTTANGHLIECDKCKTTYLGEGGHWHEYKCDPIGSSFDVAISGFSNKVAWLVFCAFHIGKAVDKTGFGKRVSLALVKAMGRSALGLGYAVCLAELVLAPFIPSNTARGGGIVYPIVESVIASLGIDPQAGESAVGGFMSLVGSSANLISSSLFVTGMAGNPLVASKAASIFGIEFGFTQWLLGASVPALLAMFMLPPITHILLRPKLDFRQLTHSVQQQSNSLGSISREEYRLCGTLLTCLTLWVGTSYFNIDATVVAYMAIVILILLNVLSWDEVVKNHKAWDTFFWLASFIVLAEQLTALGVTDWIGNSLSRSLHGASPLLSTVSLSLVYFFSMYLFSSISSHVVAFVGPFFTAGRVLGCPPMLLAILIALFSSMAGILTPFSTGSVAIYASQGYVSQPKWFFYGLVLSLSLLVITFTVGLIWWKILGWY